ncbi:MAG: beta/gamma crystallin-related protein [Nostoc sp.]|uniref:beta/gamma crystallin-related protein n=1 Tax=Nostoc sp. TaxID=1180 RepID=UPI002FF8B0D5
MLSTKENLKQIEMDTIQQEPLFTELTPEAAATVEGGADIDYALEVFKHSRETIPNESLGSFDRGKKELSPGADNQISSVNVRAGRWIFYDRPGGGGLSWVVTKTGFQNVPLWLNDKISSIRRSD